MYLRLKKISAVLLLLSVAGGGLSILAAKAATDAKPLDCTFDAGAAWTYTGGAFAPRKPDRLSFVIADVDMQRQTARLVTDKGEAKLRTVLAVNARHFIEVASAGFLNLTTVYDKDLETGRYPAVHSRHFGVLGQALVSQFRGSCRDKS